MSQTYVQQLGDGAAVTPEQVGSKAFNLIQLMQAGFPVPEGIVVTTSAFAHHTVDIAFENGLEQVRSEVKSKELAAELREELQQTLTPWQGVPVAVRSSGVAEDLEEASFAGQYDTFLGIEGYQSIVDAIRKCWASAFSEHIWQYRSTKQIVSGHMAVLIQPLIEADASGVAFTVHPITGDSRETLVSAVCGLGERLVSGQATPDEWRVRGSEAIADSTPEQAISSKEVLQIAALARRVEAHFHAPQDIEWAIHNGNVYLLQARPITTLEKTKQGTNDHRQHEAEENMIPIPIDPPEGFWEREDTHYPDPVSPATRSTFVPAISHAFGHMSTQFSLMIEGMEQREIGGWIYQRTVPVGGKDRKAPPAWLMPLLIRLVPNMRSRVKGLVQFIREDQAGQLINRWYAEWKPLLIRHSKGLQQIKLKDLSDDQLIEHLHKVHQFLRDCLEKHMLINGAIQLSLAEFAFACKELLGWDEPKMMLMFSGLSEMSSAPSRAMAELAQFVNSQPKMMEEIHAGVTLAELLERYPTFSEEFSDYIEQFGFRALRCELNFPTVAESSELLFRLLKDQLQRSYLPDENTSILEEQRRSQLAEAKALLKDQPEADKNRFINVLERAEKTYPLREEHGFYNRDAPLALLRYAYLEAGRRFVIRGHLEGNDDVFFLEFEEVLSTFKQHDALSERLKQTVEHRRGQRNWALAHPGPASYGPMPPPPPAMDALPEEARFGVQAVLWSIEHSFATELSSQAQDHAGLIKGLAASSGQYTGTVRVIQDESEFDKIQPGDVLVCPITSPVWSMLFPSIGALVTDSGGILSHSAIIAREYRIPGVVATSNATQLLQDGQRVTVDGDRGIVELV